MACLEHVCRDCGHEWFDNSMSRVCPACGSTDTARYFDEVDDEPDYSEGHEDDEEEEF